MTLGFRLLARATDLILSCGRSIPPEAISHRSFTLQTPELPSTAMEEVELYEGGDFQELQNYILSDSSAEEPFEKVPLLPSRVFRSSLTRHPLPKATRRSSQASISPPSRSHPPPSFTSTTSVAPPLQGCSILPGKETPARRLLPRPSTRHTSGSLTFFLLRRLPAEPRERERL